MRKTIGASEGASIYLFGVCASSILALFLNLILINNETVYAGMSLYSWIGYALIQVAFLGTVFAYSAIRRLDIIYIAKTNKFISVKQLILLPFIAIATILVFLPLANLWSAFLNLIGYSGSGATMPDYSNVGVYFVSLLVMAILPAFGEEFLMRGTVFRGLSTKSVWFGILMSALFFSLMHTNPLQTVHQFGLGIVLGVVFALSGSIWPCVILHFLNNFISITISAYLPVVNEWYYTLGAYNWLTGAGSFIVGIILLVILLFLYYKLGKNGKVSISTPGVDYDNVTFYVVDPEVNSKGNIFKDLGRFIKSLFKKDGWIRITRTLEDNNDIQIIGKKQPMVGVYLSLGIMVIYWLYTFIYGLVV